MTAQLSSPTHTEIVMEMLSVAARVGTSWVSVEDIAHRLYGAARPAHYVESIRSTIQRLRKLLAERQSGIIADGQRYAIALDMPGVFRAGQGFTRRIETRRGGQPIVRAVFVEGAHRRVGRG